MRQEGKVRMILRIQIRADGPSADSVSSQLQDAADRIHEALGVELHPAEQVVEGVPGQTFSGRLSLTRVAA